MCVEFIFFFFQAEDGIRDWSVTGVQTCALPIPPPPPPPPPPDPGPDEVQDLDLRVRLRLRGGTSSDRKSVV